MRSRSLFVPALVLALFSFNSPASATIWQYFANIDGLQETPPNASPGFGYADVLIDDVALTMSVNGSFSGMVSNATDAHVHGPAGLGVPAGVVYGLTFTPSSSGTVTGTSGALTSTQISNALAGLTYINIHTSAFPGGEIRGQIVPEPACAGLLAIAAMAGLSRRRRA